MVALPILSRRKQEMPDPMLYPTERLLRGGDRVKIKPTTADNCFMPQDLKALQRPIHVTHITTQTPGAGNKPAPRQLQPLLSSASVPNTSKGLTRRRCQSRRNLSQRGCEWH